MAVKTIIQHRRDTAANWTSNNPTLAEGELGFVIYDATLGADNSTVGYFKIGRKNSSGTLLAWNDLAFTNITGASGPTGATGAAGRGYTGVTSTTSNSIATGSKTFSVSSSGAFLLGDRVRVINSATNYMEGTVTAVTTDSSITVNVDSVSGSGTLTSWTFSIAGLVGQTGATGTTGTAGRGYDSLTSTSSVSIATGSKSFTMASTGALALGTRVRAAYVSATSNYVEGVITAVTTDTSITVNVDAVGGSGTYASWAISVAGNVGATGATGAAGTSGVIAVTAPITNSGTSGSATIGINAASTTQAGAVQLTDSTSSTSTTTAATPNSVKAAYDLANAAIPKTSKVPGAYNFTSTSGGTVTAAWVISLTGASAPTVRPDGTSLAVGDLWISW
jgi:hypothetical protein